MSDKIKVISAYDGRCGIDNVGLHISRRWQGRGDSVVFTREQIEELQFDTAFMNMVREGILYIDDMEIKKEIGIEPDDAEEPTLILLDEKTLRRLWKDMPLAQFKLETKSLTKPQLQSLADYAIYHGSDGSIEKATYLTTISGQNILKGIELEKQSQEG